MVHYFPGWNGTHALIVSIPIILLLIAPLFVIVGTVLPSAKGQPFLVWALILMILGTVTVFVAAATGEAAMRVLGPSPATQVALEQHRDLAGTTEELFLMLTLAFAALLFVPRLLGNEFESWVNSALLAAFLVFYATGALFLANTVHHGGHVVHELGHKAPVTGSGPIKEARQ
jgi:uncharacterized membrane protein